MAESPESSNQTSKPPTLSAQAALFPSIPKTTVISGMKRGRKHRKKMREEHDTIYSKVIKRLGKKKVSPQLEEEFLVWLKNHDMVVQSPIVKDSILVRDPSNPRQK